MPSVPAFSTEMSYCDRPMRPSVGCQEPAISK